LPRAARRERRLRDLAGTFWRRAPRGGFATRCAASVISPDEASATGL